MDKLRFISSERYYEGIIIELTDGSVVIDLKGRMGQLRLPRRMVICENELKEGQQVGFLMTYPEVIDEEIDKGYLESAKDQLYRRINSGNII
ncbi:CBO2463/CBO2479 domain-containing protein [Clostridium sp. Cult3]|jgi:hypothetical protein|uniref:CBO2463/CBO2479 domain-containing protein n=1 Tax=Clostridium sp. Cult3 TaxID=2079004 RepID=UPI001F460175|nr:CBO2463/CBO2479 domain-containing protein [Clostridium sp. Cult3]MCF6460796.1 hypothetical protein [Clostridium sp. Cult3]